MQRRGRQRTELTPEELFGMALRERRKERGLSQETLAFESGYHPSYIGQIERGRKSPSLRTIVSLASVLSMLPSGLMQRFEVGLRKGWRPEPRTKE
jgi:transcriptional regulator with XRE-family HTH domain